jgi:DNA-binding NarL/FixJ family response regulator
MKGLNVLIADDHSLILEGIKSVLLDLEMPPNVFFASDLAQLELMLKSEKIDVLIQDVKFGNDDARQFIPSIRANYPDLKVVAISSLGDAASIQTIINSGINGYVLKSEGSDQLVQAINHVLAGERFLSRSAQNALFQKQESSPLDLQLSEREKEVLKAILAELSTKQIAEQLFLSEKTIEHYRSTLFVKFDVKNVTGLVKKAIILGFWED